MEQCADFGLQCSLVCLAPGSSRWFIGAELAASLNKETFNLYSSLKRRGIEIRKVDHDVLSDLIASEIVPQGITSVTLIPATPETIQYVRESLEKLRKRLRKRPREITGAQEEELDASFALAKLAATNEREH